MIGQNLLQENTVAKSVTPISILESISNGIKPNERAQQYWGAQVKSFALGYHILGYNQFTKLQFNWLKEVEEQIHTSHKRQQIKLLRLHPRDHFKSTCFSVCLPHSELIQDNQKRILLVSNTGRQAEGFHVELQGNMCKPDCVAAFGQYQDLSRAWSNQKSVIRGAETRKEPSIQAVGVGGSIISVHVHLMIIDDIVDQKNARTKLQRENLRAWFNETLVPILTPDGTMIVVGTRYHSDDLYSYLMGKKTYHITVESAIKEKTLIRGGENNDGRIIGGEVLMPERYNIDQLADKEEEMAESGNADHFSAQYQNKIISARGQIFKPEYFQYIKYAELMEKTKNLEGMYTFIALDPAISEANSSCFSFFVVVAIDSEENWYVLRAKCGHWNKSSDIMENFFQLCSRYSPANTGIEKIQFQQALFDIFELMAREKHYKPRLTEIVRGNDVAKETRIKTIEPRFRKKKVWFVLYDDPAFDEDMEELEDELSGFPKHKMMDGPDVLSMITEIMFVPSNKQEDDRVTSNVEAMQLHDADEETGCF